MGEGHGFSRPWGNRVPSSCGLVFLQGSFCDETIFARCSSRSRCGRESCVVSRSLLVAKAVYVCGTSIKPIFRAGLGRCSK